MYRLKACVWELTRACTLQCIHCGSQAGVCRENELKEQEALNIAGQLVDLGCKNVTLIGGEVTLCAYWSRLARYFSENGVSCCIVTNGYRKTEQDFAAIRESGIVSAALSMDGMESLHNQIRGRGDAFAEAERFIRNLRDTGVPLTTVTTITQKCVGQLEELYRWVKRNGVRTWQWQQVSPMGNAGGQAALALRPEDVSRIFDIYGKLSAFRGRPPIVLADNLGYYARRAGRILQPFDGCAAGLSAVGIDSVGNVRGCESLYDDAFIEGNLREQSLKEIWESPESFAYNRRFTPEFLEGKCLGCDEGAVCAGGCRSFNAFHGALYENVNCVKEDEHGSEKMQPWSPVYG
ncbi:MULTISPECIES: radical SAM protein [Enterocloster]|uniref:Radical SAM additional 4Fe4S-binding SPASM domain-containing protein n=1 Tax=Enterocloster lavalensis TaxID=460384 RepID=A0A1I0EXB2_9FIRM|nr:MULTISPECIES: radical SAM protein [Enterocloster]MDR3758916.1 radical SAM protein [Enterocloster sp.]PST30247.1 radical SAM protein [Enterocloster lavalensis]SET50158.1 radical SAM additional 4Fe4S-binding SPASM domain-containing protein [Enterocloster lavalensis]